MANVLLIEGDEQIAASLAKVMRQQGRVVETADHGSAGLAKLNAASGCPIWTAPTSSR